jgi:hypothetical protein
VVAGIQQAAWSVGVNSCRRKQGNTGSGPCPLPSMPNVGSSRASDDHLEESRPGEILIQWGTMELSANFTADNAHADRRLLNTLRARRISP